MVLTLREDINVDYLIMRERMGMEWVFRRVS
jgi:hypothetical protein